VQAKSAAGNSQVNDRDWQREVEQLLEDRLVSVCEVLDQPFPRSGLRVVPPLAPTEAKSFLVGIEAGLFELDREGYVLSPLLAVPSEDKTESCQIFWRDPPPPRLFRERICQLATAAALVLERGWQTSQIELEPATIEEDAQRNDVDIVVKSTSGELFAAVEIKRSAPELNKLQRDFYQCCKRGKHPEAECGFPQNHAKYEFCAAHRPSYLWAVAPGEDICFKLTYSDNGTIELEELPTFPARSVIELQHRRR
jgi:hypothetical protein